MDAWKLIERDHGNITELVHDIPNAMNGSGVIGSLERLLGDLIDELQTYADGSCPSMRWKFGVELERPSVRRPEVELL